MLNENERTSDMYNRGFRVYGIWNQMALSWIKCHTWWGRRKMDSGATFLPESPNHDDLNINLSGSNIHNAAYLGYLLLP